MMHSAGGGRLAAIDYAAAGLDRQLALECKVGVFEELEIVGFLSSYLNSDFQFPKKLAISDKRTQLFNF